MELAPASALDLSSANTSSRNLKVYGLSRFAEAGSLRSPRQSKSLFLVCTSEPELNGAPKLNVLPTVATATVNFRLFPGDTVDSVTAHVRDAIGDLPVTIKPVGVMEEPSRIARMDAPGDRLVAGVASTLLDMPVISLAIPAPDGRPPHARHYRRHLSLQRVLADS
jgi:acetylornithine deacetylase/succinyl-diaminopimelate desuccinylase-like protein